MHSQDVIPHAQIGAIPQLHWSQPLPAVVHSRHASLRAFPRYLGCSLLTCPRLGPTPPCHLLPGSVILGLPGPHTSQRQEVTWHTHVLRSNHSQVTVSFHSPPPAALLPPSLCLHPEVSPAGPRAQSCGCKVRGTMPALPLPHFPSLFISLSSSAYPRCSPCSGPISQYRAAHQPEPGLPPNSPGPVGIHPCLHPTGSM